VNNYTKVRVTNINPSTIINNYQAAPVVNNTVVKNYTTIKQRFNFTNVPVKEKPHNTVVNRIQQNQTIIHEGKKEKGSVVQERAQSIPEGRINREARIEAPKITNHIVPAGEINRPRSAIKPQEKVIKSISAAGKSEQQPEQPPAQSERAAPVRPSRPEKYAPAARPEQASPAKPAQPQQPASQSERLAPQRAAPVKNKEIIKPPEREFIEKPNVKPLERDLEKPIDTRTLERQKKQPKEQIPAQKNIDKQKKPSPPEKDVEKQKVRKRPGEEEEKPKE
jgi:hypothetical protein